MSKPRKGHGPAPVDKSPSLPPLAHKHTAPGPNTGRNGSDLNPNTPYPVAPTPPKVGRLASFVRERAGRYKGL